MMKALAQRYARALADVALEEKSAETVKKEYAEFVRLLEESADLRNFLASPAVARAAKHGVIEKLIARMKAGRTLRNFLMVVVENRRSQLLPQIREAFEAELYARMGVTRAWVTSARELSEEEKGGLRGALESVTGKRVEAYYGVDPELIGGAVARVGSTIYDGSVRAQLDRLRARLASE